MRIAYTVVIALSTLLPHVTQASTQVWFGPIKSDFLSDRSQDAAWANARKHIQVYKFYYQGIVDTPVPELKEKFRFLRENNIAVAVEWPAMTWQENGVGYKIEGFAPKGFSQQIVNKIKAAGGTLDYVAMDEVVFFGHKKALNQFSPQHPIDKVATEVAANLKDVWAVFPNAKVGDVEPLEQFGDGYLQDMKTWLAEYKKATGRNLDFLHADVVWEENWKETLPNVMKVAKQNGTRFGVIFNATKGTGPDYYWMISARKNINSYMNSGISIPDDIVFQSWNRFPAKISEDSAPQSHASLVPYLIKERQIYRK